jgi:large subunit ribosomal protein L5
MTAPRLQNKYDETIISALQEEFKYGNPHEIPRIVKVVANMAWVKQCKTPRL